MQATTKQRAKVLREVFELVRLLEHNGFTLIKEKCSIRYYGKPEIEREE